MKGGIDGNGEKTNSTEIYSDNNFEIGPELPVAVSGHCVEKLNETHAILSGGLTENIDYLQDVWLINLISGESKPIESMVKPSLTIAIKLDCRYFNVDYREIWAWLRYFKKLFCRSWREN